MAFNIFATATSDIPLANLDANFTMIGSSAVASTLYPTATTSITYGTAGTSHIFSGSIGAFTLGGTVAGGGNQLNNVIIGTTTPLAGAFTTITGGGRLQLTALGSPPASGSGLELGGGSSPIIFSYNRTSSAYLPLDLTASAFGWSISGTSIGTFSSTGINGMAIGATTPSTGAFTTLSSTGDLTLSGTVGRVVSNANSKRVLIAGGSTATTTTGAYAIFEGYDYGGAGAGGAISLVSAAGTTNPITMSVGGTTRGVFSSTGLAVTGTLSATTTGKVGTTLGVGAATPSASGAGITFPATQSASTDANTLDDYEEGTWTPNQGSGLTVVGAFSSVGRYTKIGNVVTVWGEVTGATSIAVASAGFITTNLPFPVNNDLGINGIATGYWTANNAAAHISIGSASSVYAAQAISGSATIGFTITYRV